jgi:hypothetical protein
VHKAIRAGRIERGADGRIDVEAADRAWLARTRSKSDAPVLGTDSLLAVDSDWSPAAQRERLIAQLAPGLVSADPERLAIALRAAFAAGQNAELVHISHWLDEACAELGLWF